MYKNTLDGLRNLADQIREGEYQGDVQLASAQGIMTRPKTRPRTEQVKDAEPTFEDVMLETFAYLRDLKQAKEAAPEASVRPVSRAQGLGVDAYVGNEDWVSVTAEVLKEFEGFREKPYYDVNAYRAGYGSDTYTTEDGLVKTVLKGQSVSREDAERDLQRRITTEFGARAKQAAGDAWDVYNPMQKAALTSIAYNYGSIPNRIQSAVRSGNASEVARAIRTLEGDNEGINKRRRRQEAEMMLYGDEDV